MSPISIYLKQMFSSTQAKLLHSFGPGYQQAIQQNQVEEFFQQAYLIWFNHFPEPCLTRDSDEYV
jgi:hypothetical protein